MEPIKKVLSKKNFEKPISIEAVQKYILENFNSSVQIQITKNNLIIIVQNSALASSIRLRQLEIIKTCSIKNLKLIIRTI